MALQGTIETFALPDVLRLLASTKKTGRLRVEGDRGSGSLWVEDGRVVAGEAGPSGNVDESGVALFELLRFGTGDFVFADDEQPADKGSPEDVEPLLQSAEAMLDEWRAIEAVVPSLDHHVKLASDLPGEEVTVSSSDWKTLVVIAGGSSVGALGDRLRLNELAVSRAVKQLSELGLVEVGEPRTDGGTSVRSSAPAPEPEPAPSPATGGSFDSFSDVATSGAEDAGGSDAFESFDPSALVIEDKAEVGFGEAEAEEPDASDAAEIARQLANLSPKAAKAVAAAARATTPEERDAALAEVDEDQDPINRELLIKFLGSVNS